MMDRLIGFIFRIGGYLLWGWTLAHVWNLFIPVIFGGMPFIRVPEAFAIMLVVTLLRPNLKYDLGGLSENEKEEKYWAEVAGIFILPIFALIMAHLINWFM